MNMQFVRDQIYYNVFREYVHLVFYLKTMHVWRHVIYWLCRHNGPVI